MPAVADGSDKLAPTDAPATGADLLFVYGTLIPGCEPAAMSHVCRRLRRVGEATVRGWLYDLGHYPAAVLADREAGDDVVIRGELVAVDADDTWRELDAYEGCPRQGEGDGLFRRVRTEAALPNGTRTGCWIYVFERDLGHARPIAGGCWRSRGA